MSEPQERSCTREGCDFATSGKCLEGLALTECPYLGAAAELGAQQDPEAEADDRAERETLPHGEALTLAEANEITRSRRTKLVVLAGAVATGKTTLITSLYEKFLEGPFAGYQFAGSETLRGLERRCALGRIASGREAPATARTTTKGARALHLRLSPLVTDSRAVPDLLLIDLAGEQYQRARDHATGVDALSFLDRSDHLVFLLDGGKLCNRKKRNVAYNDARTLLRGILERTELPKTCATEVVFSKWDLVRSSENIEEADAFVRRVQNEMHDEFHDRLPELRFTSVAARPTTQALPFAHGLSELLSRWVLDRARCPEGVTVRGLLDPKRESSRFADAVFLRAGRGGYEYKRT